MYACVQRVHALSCVRADLTACVSCPQAGLAVLLADTAVGGRQQEKRSAHTRPIRLRSSLDEMADKAAAIRALASSVTLNEFLKGRPSRNVVVLKSSQSIADALQAC